MGKLGNISGKQDGNAFQKKGWHILGQVGSHLMMSKSGLRVNLSVPQHKELSVGTLRAFWLYFFKQAENQDINNQIPVYKISLHLPKGHQIITIPPYGIYKKTGIE